MQRKPNRFAALGLVAVGAVACTSNDEIRGHLALVRVSEQFASQDCPAGGQAVESGSDTNGNGQLDDAEVTSSQTVCNGADGPQGAAAKPGKTGKAGASGSLTAVQVSDEPAGTACANGGQRIDSGVDADADGKIDRGAALDTVYVCNGVSGDDGVNGARVLVSASDEPASAHCASGGKRYDYGLDSNGDGTLQEAEVEGTRYLCNGSDGAVGTHTLFASSVEPAGAHCANGGKRIDSGQDANLNGVLDPAEVASTAYTCNGAAGAAGVQTLFAVATEAAGANCAAGGSKISYGLDDDGDGTLDPAEVDNTRYVCNGGSGQNATVVLVSVVVEPPGGNCTGGGHAMLVGLDDNGNQTLDASEVDSTSYVCDFDEFQNGSFELPAYQGWTVESTSSGQWLLATTGTTLHSGDVVFDYADNRNETLTSPGLPYTVAATDGTTVAVQEQNAPGIHRIYQDFTVPVGAVSLTWDMYYKNTNSSWDADSQYIAINIRDPKTDSVIATLYKTGGSDPLVLAGMIPFSADLTAYQGQDIRFDIETNIQFSWIDVALDHFVIH